MCMPTIAPARANWTPTLLATPPASPDAGDRNRQELQLLVAQLQNRTVEAEGLRDRLQSTLDRATALLNANYPEVGK